MASLSEALDELKAAKAKLGALEDAQEPDELRTTKAELYVAKAELAVVEARLGTTNELQQDDIQHLKQARATCQRAVDDAQHMVGALIRHRARKPLLCVCSTRPPSSPLGRLFLSNWYVGHIWSVFSGHFEMKEDNSVGSPSSAAPSSSAASRGPLRVRMFADHRHVTGHVQLPTTISATVDAATDKLNTWLAANQQLQIVDIVTCNQTSNVPNNSGWCPLQACVITVKFYGEESQ